MRPRVKEKRVGEKEKRVGEDLFIFFSSSPRRQMGVMMNERKRIEDKREGYTAPFDSSRILWKIKQYHVSLYIISTIKSNK